LINLIFFIHVENYISFLKNNKLGFGKRCTITKIALRM